MDCLGEIVSSLSGSRTGGSMSMQSPTNTQSANKASLYIEVQLTDSCKTDPLVRIEDIRHDVAKWLSGNFAEVQVDQQIDTQSLSWNRFIERVVIAGYSRSTDFPDDSFHVIANNKLDVAVYTLFTGDEINDDEILEDESTHHFRLTQLPHCAFDGMWKTLIFQEPFAEYILRFMTRTITSANNARLNHGKEFARNTILLHGPPGSGKSTLARALAQRMSIRLSPLYPRTRLLEIKSHSLLSRYFGESSKQIGKLFETIACFALDDTYLTVVVFDEIETLATSRLRSSQANEVGDSVRSTNELLRGIDRLSNSPRVCFIFTSNLIDNIDSAFLDRCTSKRFIDIPGTQVAYEILRAKLNDFIKSGYVTFHTLVAGSPLGGSPNVTQHSSDGPLDEHTSGITDNSCTDGLHCIPDMAWARTHWSQDIVTASSELERLSELAQGLSPRTLRSLVMVAMFQYTVDEPCDLWELFRALERTIREEKMEKDGIRQDEEEASVHNGMYDEIMDFVSRQT